MCVCVAKPVAVKLRCHATALIFNQIVKRIIEMKQETYQKVYPGLTCFKDGVRQIPIESIPGLQESGWKPQLDKV